MLLPLPRVLDGVRDAPQGTTQPAPMQQTTTEATTPAAVTTATTTTIPEGSVEVTFQIDVRTCGRFVNLRLGCCGTSL